MHSEPTAGLFSRSALADVLKLETAEVVVPLAGASPVKLQAVLIALVVIGLSAVAVFWAGPVGVRQRRAGWAPLPHWRITGTVNMPFTNKSPLMRVTGSNAPVTRINGSNAPVTRL